MADKSGSWKEVYKILEDNFLNNSGYLVYQAYNKPAIFLGDQDEPISATISHIDKDACYFKFRSGHVGFYNLTNLSVDIFLEDLSGFKIFDNSNSFVLMFTI